MKQATTYEEVRDFLINEKGIRTGFRVKGFKEQKELPDKVRDQVKQWIIALESDEYRQSRELLYDVDEDGYCCLGVALVGNIPKEELRKMGVPSDLYKSKAWEISSGMVKDMVTLSKENDETGWYTKNLENTLTSFNDEYHLTFDEIAMILRYKFKIYE